ncbi:MAG: hypothetical protein ACOCXQ_03965 [Patescibacteria group bacterium]
MKNILPVYKPIGKTPLEVIRDLQASDPHYTNKRIGYAGRLDPMADGLLILLIEEANNDRKTYERMQKEYVFEVLFGVATDSYDILGKITTSVCPVHFSDSVRSNQPTFSSRFSDIIPIIEEYLQGLIGTQIQAYPPYSSPRVNGRPLFYWAREGRLNEITIPEKEITIFETELIELRSIETNQMLSQIEKRINLVHGEFRQKECISSWQQTVVELDCDHLPIARIRIRCSSGTYIRSIAHQMGIDLGVAAAAYRITRTRVDSISLTSLPEPHNL